MVDGYFKRKVIEYLVLRKLSGYNMLLQAIYEYMVYNENIREVSLRYGVDRDVVRSTRQRIVEKAGGDLRLAREAVAGATHMVMRMVPEIGNGRFYSYCKICRRYIENIAFGDHVAKHHRDIVEKYTDKVMRVLGWVERK